ncbi:zinc-dependent metalloprotease [Tahibacter soli]|uniref:Zinc-dependent metalloprotease n=1 Tax=Tahibacter soli TaxID=2983605 RepID=A0A9X4BHL8_9GAMM|nr:zinc-dependent metalloprotease [Tahibacter soli]MDC8012553.1 zinc-dependent metalloprotease [Tahibacter soli]
MTSAIRAGLAVLFLLTAARSFAATGVDAATFLRQTERYAEVRVTGVRAGDAAVALELRRFEVFARNVQLVADDGHDNVKPLPRPLTRYYTGRVAGDGGGSVFLAVEPDGRARGIVDRDGAAASIDGDATRALRLVPIDTSTPRTDGGFRCDSDDLAQARGIVEKARAGQAQAATPAGVTRPYRARVAIETDYEFFQKFNDAPRAIAYVGDVIGYASTKYTAEIDTRLEVVYVRLWTSADDPWSNETSSNCALYGFGTYWNANMTGVSRTFAHMLSARQTSGGSAWIGALCAAPFSVQISAGSCNFGSGTLSAGGDYGYTGRLNGAFDPGNPQVIWDVEAPAHEIGHNFNSPHTHCYNGIGGNPDPIDRCYNGQIGCYSGVTSLPGPAGQGSGTIMSYCHLLSPGMANISMNFGTGHAYGTAPERVATRMKNYVADLAQTNPGCVVDDTLFADGFE